VATGLDHLKLAEHARAQIQAALDISQRHKVSRAGLCSCSRPQPCAVVTACRTTIATSRTKLAIIGATLPLAIITPVAAQTNRQA
jgi:hypothetical protein